MSAKEPVVVIDDESSVREAVGETLLLAGFNVTTFSSVEPALEFLSPEFAGVTLSDVRMPGEDGLSLLEKCMAIDDALPVVLMTGHGDVSMAVKAMQAGAYDFIEKPFASEHMIELIRKALGKRKLVLENRALRKEVKSRSGIDSLIIGNTNAIDQVRQTIRKVADTDVDILIEGQTGVGKELAARCLHLESSRRDFPFVAINCGAIPEPLIENELFGHEAGAFSGAVDKRIGKIEYANGGTLFLDEIESMPLLSQVKILRVLQERVIERLGSNEVVPVDIRVIAATKSDLKENAKKGSFREDLYYRLDVVKINIPALKDRLDDIPVLFRHCLFNASVKYKKELPPLTSEKMASLLSRPWPGNVRELQNEANRYVICYEGGGDDHVAADCLKKDNTPLTLPEQIAAIEKSIISEELENQNGNISSASAALGIPRKTLSDKMKKYNLGS